MKKPKPLKWLNDILNDKTLPEVVCVGIRGYYGPNQRGKYDDALFWINRRTGFIASYNGNVDPSRVRKGTGFGSKKGMAVLKEGRWLYQKGPHPWKNGYPAFRQAGPVTVMRDGVKSSYPHTGHFGINIHRGGTTGTSSLGCQTIIPVQWPDFQKTGYKLLDDAKQKTFVYILM